MIMLLTVIIPLLHLSYGSEISLPVGMNLPSTNYYTTSLPFNDAMKTSSQMITYNAQGPSDWDTGLRDQLCYDENGYPLQIPHPVAGHPAQAVRFLINNHYKGTFVVLHDGDGDLTFRGGCSRTENGRLYVELTGTGENKWFHMTRSQPGNHIRNIRIIPVEYEHRESEMPTFYGPFLQGLRPFHALRFMDWTNTNHSQQEFWQDRVTKSFYTQGGRDGTSIDYAIELANLLKKDVWLCIPHKADDQYIRAFARLVRDHLHPDLHIYLEYSNEIWNWIFDQAHYVLRNAPGAHDEYVSRDLKSISEDSRHPEKGAYMFARVFRLWREEFGNDFHRRVTRVASGQAAWPDTFDRLLRHLLENTGEGADAMSPSAYFSFTRSDHEIWNAMDPDDVTADMIIDAVMARWREYEQNQITIGKLASKYDLDLVVYEGGQHIQPQDQGEWDYNHAVWDAQIHPRMYDLYMENFRIMALPEIRCTLFLAFSYVGQRKTKWGSWGHLESLDQLSSDNMREIAPKYQALLDVNTPIHPGPPVVNILRILRNLKKGAFLPNPGVSSLQ